MEHGIICGASVVFSFMLVRAKIFCLVESG
jgi:hypothetical protein